LIDQFFYNNIVGLDDWDFVPMNDINSNIRWFNVDNRSIIATVKSTTGKKSSTLHKAISMWEIIFFEKHLS
jgi:hypothetical protein